MVRDDESVPGVVIRELCAHDVELLLDEALPGLTIHARLLAKEQLAGGGSDEREDGDAGAGPEAVADGADKLGDVRDGVLREGERVLLDEDTLNEVTLDERLVELLNDELDADDTAEVLRDVDPEVLHGAPVSGRPARGQDAERRSGEREVQTGDSELLRP